MFTKESNSIGRTSISSDFSVKNNSYNSLSDTIPGPNGFER